MTSAGVPLDARGEWEVRVAPEAIADFRDHADGRALLAACIESLEHNPRKPHKGKAGLMRGHEPIRKFRPPGFGAFRV